MEVPTPSQQGGWPGNFAARPPPASGEWVGRLSRLPAAKVWLRWIAFAAPWPAVLQLLDLLDCL